MMEELSRIKQTKLRRLSRKKGRDEDGLFIAEGVRIIEEVLKAGLELKFAVMLDDSAAKRSAETYVRRAGLLNKLNKLECEQYWLYQDHFKEFSDTQTSQGILLVCRKPRVLADNPEKPLLILDNVRDPGNLGACLRSAAAFGIKHVSLVKGCADVWSPKAVRASMGGLFPIESIWQESTIDALARAKTRKTILALDAKPELGSFFDAIDNASESLAVVIGGETHGLSGCWKDEAVTPVAIPQASDVDSLNAAMATTLATNAIWRSVPIE